MTEKQSHMDLLFTILFSLSHESGNDAKSGNALNFLEDKLEVERVWMMCDSLDLEKFNLWGRAKEDPPSKNNKRNWYLLVILFSTDEQIFEVRKFIYC